MNLVYVYEREGFYKVLLRVKDDKGKESRSEIIVMIKDGSLIELELNNCLEEVNCIGLNSMIKGNFIGEDYIDVYIFNVVLVKDIDIFVLNEYGIGMIWVFYYELDM